MVLVHMQGIGRSNLGVAYGGTYAAPYPVEAKARSRSFVVSVPEFQKCTAETEEKQQKKVVWFSKSGHGHPASSAPPLFAEVKVHFLLFFVCFEFVVHEVSLHHCHTVN